MIASFCLHLVFRTEPRWCLAFIDLLFGSMELEVVPRGVLSRIVEHACTSSIAGRKWMTIKCCAIDALRHYCMDGSFIEVAATQSATIQRRRVFRETHVHWQTLMPTQHSRNLRCEHGTKCIRRFSMCPAYVVQKFRPVFCSYDKRAPFLLMHEMSSCTHIRPSVTNCFTSRKSLHARQNGRQRAWR